MSAYRQMWLERNHGSKAQFAQPGSIKLIDTVKIEAQAKPQTPHPNHRGTFCYVHIACFCQFAGRVIRSSP